MSEKHRHHSKSHHGCLQCKKRRVKCDEARPSCERCRRRNSTCSFVADPAPWIFVAGADSRAVLHREHGLTPTSDGTPGDGRAIRHSDTRDSPSSSVSRDARFSPSQSLSPQPNSQLAIGSEDSREVQQPDVDHLRLMWYFTEHAWRSMASESHWATDLDMQKTWKEITPNLAFEHPFLLHSLLAISSLHWILACESQNSDVSNHRPPPPELPIGKERMVFLSFHHHSQGLALFREHLQQPLTDTIRVPLFLTAVFVAMHAFASPLTATTDPTTASSLNSDPLKGLLKLFTLLQGTGPIIGPIAPSIQSTPLRVLMPPEPKNAAQPLDRDSEELFEALNYLHDDILASSAYADNSTKDDYTVALGLLRQTYILHREAPDRQTIVLGFAIEVPSRVLADIAAGHALALSIAAVYSVILHRIRQVIWVQGQGRSIIRAIAQRVFVDRAKDIVQRCEYLVESVG